MVDTIESLMRAYDGDVPGASLLVIRDGEPLIRRSWGMADLEAGVPATPETNYRLASVTKQFTAASVLLLVEDGVLRLDDPVTTWLPSLPDAAKAVTIRHLLTHTAGLVDYEDLIPEAATEQVVDRDVLRLLETQDELYFEPGSMYRYSNSGYALLALVVERASGTSFAEFLRERIFEHLGMNGTIAYERGISEVTGRAYGHSRTPGGWVRDDQSITSAVLGDGGIYSSVDDLARWDAALYDDRLLGSESRRLAFSPLVETGDAGVGYGLGWRISGDRVWHTGETRGFRNAFVRNPTAGISVVILTNRNEGRPYELALEILDLVD